MDVRTCLALMVVGFTSWAGCLSDSTPEADEEEGVNYVEVPSGQWVMYELPHQPGSMTSGSPGTAYAVRIERDYTYEGPTTIPRFEHECVAAITMDDHWMPIPLTGAYRFSGPFAGTRDENVDQWTHTRIGSVGGIDKSVLTDRADPDEPGRLMAMHDAQGDRLESTLSLTPERTKLVEESSGPFWCVVGPTAFDGGTFTATNTDIDFQGGEWSRNVKDGILLRIQTDAETQDLRLRTPTSTEQIPLATGDNDLTYCSLEPGTWTIEVDRFASESSWRLTVSVADIQWPGDRCDGTWYPLRDS